MMDKSSLFDTDDRERRGPSIPTHAARTPSNGDCKPIEQKWRYRSSNGPSTCIVIDMETPIRGKGTGERNRGLGSFVPKIMGDF